MPIVEAGLHEHKLTMQTHTQLVKDTVERLTTVKRTSTEPPNDGVDLMVVWILLGIMLALASIVGAMEMFIGYVLSEIYV